MVILYVSAEVSLYSSKHRISILPIKLLFEHITWALTARSKINGYDFVQRCKAQDLSMSCTLSNTPQKYSTVITLN